MNIDEAIKVLSDSDPDIDGIMSDAYSKALKLGIEALKVIRMERQHPGRIKAGFLDGETE